VAAAEAARAEERGGGGGLLIGRIAALVLARGAFFGDFGGSGSRGNGCRHGHRLGLGNGPQLAVGFLVILVLFLKFRGIFEIPDFVRHVQSLDPAAGNALVNQAGRRRGPAPGAGRLRFQGNLRGLFFLVHGHRFESLAGLGRVVDGRGRPLGEIVIEVPQVVLGRLPGEFRQGGAAAAR
jgi:hypothetical protein